MFNLKKKNVENNLQEQNTNIQNTNDNAIENNQVDKNTTSESVNLENAPKTLEQKFHDLEKYVEQNQAKVFKYTLGTILVLCLTLLLLAVIPNSFQIPFYSSFMNKELTEQMEKKANEIVEKAEVRSKLNLTPISNKYTNEQAHKYIDYVNQYIDKYKGEQNLYTNVLEFISNNCVNPINQNTNLLVKSLVKKMTEHEKYFDENNKIIKSLTDHCTPPVEKYELPDNLKTLRTNMFKYKYTIDNRYLEIEQIQLKHGKENVNPITGDLTLNFVSEEVIKEQNNRKERFRKENLMYEVVKKDIAQTLMNILHKPQDNTPGILIFATIMRDYGADFEFFYDYYATMTNPENAKQLKAEVTRLIEHNKQTNASR